MRFLLFCILAVSLNAFNIVPENYHGKIKFIKQEKLDYDFDGLNFSELSDLAYDKNSHTLYAVSDKGILFTFIANINDNGFKLTPLNGYKLKRKNGKRLKRWKRDSEGLTLDNRNNLYISFEGKPKISLYRKDGVKIKNIKLPKALKRAKLRSKNKSLESLAWHPKYGLLTALEYSKVSDKKENQTIYSTSGKSWRLKMEPIHNNAITAIEVMDDGNLLILERAYNGLLGKFQVNLVKMYINGCKSGEFCKKEKLLTIDSAKGWEVENFEGLCRVGKNRYLMVSDDNDSILASTVLIYFELTRN